MADNAKIAVIGIGDDGVEAMPLAVRQRVMDAEVIFGVDRALDFVPPEAPAQRLPLSGDLSQVASQLEAAEGKRAAILIFGDPMFYGLARYATERLGKERFEVFPHVSSMQLAFARVMESWDEAYLTNLAHHSVASVVEKIRTATKVGLFTTEECGPSQVARAMLDRRIDYFNAYVCENLGARDERVTRGALAEIVEMDFAPLNVMILVRMPDAPDRPAEAIGRRIFGNADDAFLQSQPKQGLLTPSEVRSLALAQLDIAPSSIVWDVGAGSGSVSIEAAQLASNGEVYAIEMDAEDHGLIQENAERFGVRNVIPVLGTAPEVWRNLPDPDCVFIAGSGREVTRISEEAFARLRSGGRLVVNLVSIDNLTELRQAMSKQTSDVPIWMVNIARGADQLGRLSFESLKPSFLLAVSKG